MPNIRSITKFILVLGLIMYLPLLINFQQFFFSKFYRLENKCNSSLSTQISIEQNKTYYIHLKIYNETKENQNYAQAKIEGNIFLENSPNEFYLPINISCDSNELITPNRRFAEWNYYKTEKNIEYNFSTSNSDNLIINLTLIEGEYFYIVVTQDNSFLQLIEYQQWFMNTYIGTILFFVILIIYQDKKKEKEILNYRIIHHK